MNVNPLTEVQFFLNLLDEIELGLRDFYSYTYRARLPILRARIQDMALSKLNASRAMPKAPSALSRQEENSQIRALMQDYLEYLPSSYYLRDRPAEQLPQAALIARGVSSAVLAEFGLDHAGPEFRDDPAYNAWVLARYNHLQTLGREAAISYLLERTGYRQSGQDEQSAELDAASEILRAHDLQYRMTAMKFAIVLQGEPLEQQRKELALESFGESHSLIQYVTDLEHLPGRYQSKTEQELRDSIAKHLGTASGEAEASS